MNELIELLPKLPEAILQTLLYVTAAMTIGGGVGLVLGVVLVVTRRGGIAPNAPVFYTLNFLVNFVRPIPFLILAFTLQPLARLVTGTGIGDPAFIFMICFACTFGISRLVEQNLLTVPPGVIEAARAMGASRIRIILTVLIPEGLGPLVLGYTFAFVAIMDMTALAGILGAEGLGNFALLYGYRQFNPWVTWTAMLIIIAIVQLVQLFGNSLARRLLRR